jgi:flavin-dependent dehydrogenase
MRNYDVVIAGGSFAGLAVARELAGRRVLLLDRKKIGAGQTSACGTFLLVPEKLGLTDSVLQKHESLFLHLKRETLEFKMSFPFCTLDYQKFCRGLLRQGKVEFRQESVLGLEKGRVKTEKGIYRGEVLVEASGWGAALLRRGFHLGGGIGTTPRVKGLSSGLETVLPYQERGLHFWYLPDEFDRKTIFWLFPAGKTARFGVGDYLGRGSLKEKLARFLKKFDLEINHKSLHGGFFPHRLPKGRAGHVFLVGDSAGQCLPLLGEGIRPALAFGSICGRMIKRVLEGEMSLEAGLKEYDCLVRGRRLSYALLLGMQKFFTNTPASFLRNTAKIVQKQSVLDFVLRNYLKIIPF